jgi:hypothetical protein
MTHLLDTDTCIGVLRQRPGMVQRLSQLAPTDCAVSMVTVYELFCGVEKAIRSRNDRKLNDSFLRLSSFRWTERRRKKPRRFAPTWNGRASLSALTICSSPDKQSPAGSLLSPTTSANSNESRD